ncbi:Uncharacterised protein [uncultured archaeon]|nr:Uncharacterised protein [uncultured archaeon]
MASTLERSFVKGIVWEGFSFIITFIAIYLFYGNLGQSLLFTFWFTLIKIILFFAHERIWKEIKWGKYHIDGVKISSKKAK